MYTKEEVEELCRKAFIAGFSLTEPNKGNGIEEWLKENLKSKEDDDKN